MRRLIRSNYFLFYLFFLAFAVQIVKNAFVLHIFIMIFASAALASAWNIIGGYGGQFLMVDPKTATACAFMSVLENDAGYDEAYMTDVIVALEAVLVAG